MTAASEAGIYRNPPEPGQLVEVRRRQWVVAEVDASTQGAERQHAVTLSSIDEDALGEELRVIWEIEPGAHVIERAGGDGRSDRLVVQGCRAVERGVHLIDPRPCPRGNEDRAVGEFFSERMNSLMKFHHFSVTDRCRLGHMRC